MSRAARLILWGLLMVAAGIAAYAAIDWQQVLGHHPRFLRPLKVALRATLQAAWYWAFAVPAMMLAGAAYRFVVAKGGRLMVAWKLFAYFTLWAIGSFAFFFGLFLVYAPGLGEGGTQLLAPAMLACVGYFILGVGFVLSLLDKARA